MLLGVLDAAEQEDVSCHETSRSDESCERTWTDGHHVSWLSVHVGKVTLRGVLITVICCDVLRRGIP
jgi:hypothetical protein